PGYSNTTAPIDRISDAYAQHDLGAARLVPSRLNHSAVIKACYSSCTSLLLFLFRCPWCYHECSKVQSGCVVRVHTRAIRCHVFTNVRISGGGIGGLTC